MRSKGRSCEGISPRDLRDLESLTIDPLVNIFNSCLKAGTFPESWLTSKVIFNYKSGKKTIPSNYRTIQIQHACMKMFSKLMSHRLDTYLESYEVLDSSMAIFDDKKWKRCLENLEDRST